MAAASVWVALWYISNDILDEASLRSTVASSAQTQSDRAAYTQRLSSLVSDTQGDRAALEALVGMNIVSIVTLIEQVGTQTGITVKVNSAQPQGSSVALPLSEIAFAVEADGSFAQVMRTVQALERLPVPSTIEQLEFMQNTGDSGKKGTWHLSALVGVFTTSAGS